MECSGVCQLTNELSYLLINKCYRLLVKYIKKDSCKRRFAVWLGSSRGALTVWSWDNIVLGEESAQAIPEYMYIGTDLQLVGMLVHRLLGELSTILKGSY